MSGTPEAPPEEPSTHRKDEAASGGSGYAQPPASPQAPPPPPPPQGPPPYWSYPPNPWGSPYYPLGYYPPPPPYYMPVYAYRGPDHTAATVAGILWALVLVRDILFLAAWLLIGPAPPFNSFAGGSDFEWLAIVTAVGAAGAGLALAVDFQRTNYDLGTIGATVAVVGSSFPGIFFIGPFGLVLALIAATLHAVAAKSFKSR